MNIESRFAFPFMVIIPLFFSPTGLYAFEYNCELGDGCGSDPSYNMHVKSSGWDVCNKTKFHKINVSIGFNTSSKWNSKGSYFIGKDECVNVLGNISSSDHLYYLVRNNNKHLPNKQKKRDGGFCIHSNFKRKFRFGDEFNKDKRLCKSKGHEWWFFDYYETSNYSYFKTYVY